MVFAEALALGTPVVSFAHAAIKEAVKHGETGLLVPERAVGPLADSMLASSPITSSGRRRGSAQPRGCEAGSTS
jgi:glycosyltransferase involved in cell wall biosynthesis